MKKLVVAIALFATSAFASADQTYYIDRSDVESGRFVPTVPTVYPYAAVGCKPPYVPKLYGFGCELPMYSGYQTPFSLHLQFQYRRR